MRDILDDLAVWSARSERFALATVIRTWQSSPRPAGAAMAVSESGAVVGSVSGGCVEGTLYELAAEVLADGVSRTEIFTVANDDAIGVGLTCGGTIVVYLQLITPDTFPDFARVPGLVAAGEPVAVLTDCRAGEPPRHLVVTAEDAWGSMGGGEADDELIGRVRTGLQSGASGLGFMELGVMELGPAGSQDLDQVLVEAFGTAPRMYVFGAIDFAAAMCRIGKFAGYHVTVIDARAVFATAARFPDADEVVVDWPHRFLAGAPVDPRTIIAVLTHDEKFDIPLLELALRTDAAYVGALGSRATHERRMDKLIESGLGAAELDRLHSPIGLDLGARTPEETAISIMAEVLKTTRDATGLELRSLTGPIHREAAAALGGFERSKAVEGC
ncbi:XdhC family protein [Tomitella biformata]|uniref:XdhC family protein n=1 Tax=Tomitella biformata TaxID=630403 RepID=UPI000466563D|nr:XdhC/CoxI family protein [Tomitella biformata]